MRGRKFSRIFVCLAVLGLVAAACSGDDEAAGGVTGGPGDQIDAGSGGVAPSGQLTGLLTAQPSFGLGLYIVDPGTGQALALPAIGAVDSVDRDNDVVLNDVAAFTLGSKTRPDQSLARDVSVVRVDLSTGQAVALAPVGFDRESDESTDVTAYTIEAVTNDVVVVRSLQFGSGSSSYQVFDATSGEPISSLDALTYEFSSAQGSCSAEVGNLVGLSDGRVVGTALGSPAVVDPESGDIELLVECDAERQQLGDLIPAAEIARYAVVAGETNAAAGAPTDLLVSAEIDVDSTMVEGNGDLWWIQADAQAGSDVQLIVGGVVQFDLQAGAVEAIYALGPDLGRFTDCTDAVSCEPETLADAELRFVDGRLIIVSTNDNGPVLVLDPGTGSVTTIAVERGPGIDVTSARLLGGDPEAVWLEIRRSTVIDSDDGPSMTGADFIERLDPASGVIDLSLASADIFF